jgi:hypothetical protein
MVAAFAAYFLPQLIPGQNRKTNKVLARDIIVLFARQQTGRPILIADLPARGCVR